MAVESVSEYSWNECPDQRGISVRMLVEWVSEWSWNPQYRSKTAPVRANREKALLSSIWNFARQSGYTALANPCSGIKGNKESGRDVYVEDDLLQKVYAHAGQPLRDALDLFYLTAQRIADTLKMDERDVRNGQLTVQQGKTSVKRRIEIVGEFGRFNPRARAGPVRRTRRAQNGTLGPHSSGP